MFLLFSHLVLFPETGELVSFIHHVIVSVDLFTIKVLFENHVTSFLGFLVLDEHPSVLAFNFVHVIRSREVVEKEVWALSIVTTTMLDLVSMYPCESVIISVFLSDFAFVTHFSNISLVDKVVSILLRGNIFKCHLSCMT